MCYFKYLGNFMSPKGEIFGKNQYTLYRNHKAYLPVAQNYSFTDFVLLV